MKSFEKITRGVVIVGLAALVGLCDVVFAQSICGGSDAQTENYTFQFIGAPAGSHDLSLLGINNNAERKMVGTYYVGSTALRGVRIGPRGYTVIKANGQETRPRVINDHQDIGGDFDQPGGGWTSGFFRRGDGTISVFNVPRKTKRTYFTSMNNLNHRVGYYFDSSDQRWHGWVRLESGVYQTVDFPGATTNTFLTGINDSDQIVGHYWYRDGGSFIESGFFLEKGVFTDFNTVSGGCQMIAYGINNHGDIVGASNCEDSRTQGFLYNIHSRLFNNHCTDFVLFVPVDGGAGVATGINDSGQIVGWAYFDIFSGPSFGFIATPDPTH